MPYITSVERIGIEKGMQQGMQQGERTVLKRMSARRFGPLPTEILARIDAATTDQLEQWADNILDARSIEEVFGHR